MKALFYQHQSISVSMSLTLCSLNSSYHLFLPLFFLFDTCSWFATYFDKIRIPIDNTCPRCNANNNELTSFSIMSNESFTFDYNDKHGVELEFKPRGKDH